jgi:hypothetical protein
MDSLLEFTSPVVFSRDDRSGYGLLETDANWVFPYGAADNGRDISCESPENFAGAELDP